MKAVLLTISVLAAASTYAANIGGKVTDGRGSGLAGVDVRIRAKGNNLADLLTDARGDYKAMDLKPQKIVITFMRNGFQPHPYSKEFDLKEGVSTLNIMLIQESQSAAYYRDVATTIVLSTSPQRKELEAAMISLPEPDEAVLRSEVAALDQTIQKYAKAFENNGYHELLRLLRKGVESDLVNVAPNQLSFEFPAAFKSESAVLKPDARVHINRLASTISRNPNVMVTVFGFTDATGSNDYNTYLSSRRAKSAGSIFLRNDVDEVYIEGKGAADYRFLGLPPSAPALRSVVIVVALKDQF